MNRLSTKLTWHGTMIKKPLKLYRHYKNKHYKYLGTVRHSESLDELVLYRCLYENDLGPLWVRPKELFFSSLEVGNRIRSRFEQVEFRFELQTHLSDQTKEDAVGLLNQVFGSYDIAKLTERLEHQTQILLVSAYDGDTFVGFKLGYKTEDKIFYSWLGAVAPTYRGLGIGKELMTQQHDWCSKNSFEVVTTKTLNKWKEMLILNIQSGFQITGTEPMPNGDIKIHLAKQLT